MDGGGCAGGGGSGYANSRLTNVSQQTGGRMGNGAAQITVINATETVKYTDETKLENIVKQYLTSEYLKYIPSYVTTAGHTIVNPIWVCEGKFDEHVCTDKCKTFANGGVEITLNCHEPHHYGEHYEEGNEICYDPCNNDAKHSAGAHKEATKNKDKDNKPSEGNNNAVDSGFIRLDNYFSVYYPCLGDFYETSDNGIEKCEQAKGIGYVNSMDCSEWTREKWIRFPYSTLYYRESLGKWEEHQADEWYQVDIGYTDAEGHFHPYNYYKFYCQLKNEELSMAKVDFMVEAINDKGPETSPYGYETPYGRDEIKAQDCPEDNQWKTNAKRFDGTDGDNAKSIMYDAYHSAYRNYYIDVVGRIGNLQIEPKYYAFDTWKKKVIPVDVHMSDGEDTKTINYFGLMDEYGTKRYDEYSAKLYHDNMNLDWKHEQKERNATGKEWEHTLAVSKVFYNYVYRDTPDGPKLVTTGEGGNETALRVNLDIPHGEHYSLGDIQFQYLDTGRTATYFGDSTVPALNSGTVDDTDDYTSTVNSGINGGIDQELWHNYGVLGEEGGQNDVHDYQYWIKGQRWHTRLGLPSNVRFTDASDKNGDDLPDHVSPDSLTTDEHGSTIREWEKFDNDEIEKKTGRRRYIFLETATITAIGDPWDLRYDQKENNGHITVGSKYTGGETYTYYFEQTHDKKNSIWDFPTLLAVYDNNDISTDSDYDTLQTH